MQNDPLYTFWRKRWITVAFVAAVLISLLGVWLFFNRVQTNPERAFWGMVEQSLTTKSVTVQASQRDETGQNSIKQTVAMSLGAQNAARAYIDIQQMGMKVKTDVVATPTADYTRYTSVEVDKAALGGKSLDTKNLTNVWAKGEPQLLNQSALGLGLSLGSVPVPIGSVTAEQRNELVKQIKDRALYRVNFDKVSKERKDGRLLYTYDVESAPFVYVQIMKLFAKDIGVKAIEQINPADYRELDILKMRLTIDVRSQQLTKVVFAGSGYTQDYSAYGVPVVIEQPAKHIALDELRGRFQSALGQ